MKFTTLSKARMLAATAMALSLVTSTITAADTVVTFQQDLFKATLKGKQKLQVNKPGVEAACIAISLAQNVLLPIPGPSDPPTDTLASQPVVLFPATAGVKLVNESLLIESGIGDELCADPNFGDDGKTPLLQHLKHFIALGGDVVVCPLCWNSRGYNKPVIAGTQLGNEPYPDGNLVSAGVDDCPVADFCLNVGEVSIGNGYTIGAKFKNAARIIDF